MIKQNLSANVIRHYFIIVIVITLKMFTLSAALAQSTPTKWGALISGSLTTIAVHELGHIAVAEYHDIDYKYDGVTLVYPDADLSESEHLRLASAGFQAQWGASEIAFRTLSGAETLTEAKRSFARGVILGHIATTLAYATILKNHEDGDIEGMSQASGLSNNELALIVSIPAVLDYWRLFGTNVPDWIPAMSIGSKGLGITSIWTF